MKLKVNGEDREIAAGSTVSDLLTSLTLTSTGVAVAVNGRVVPRSQHPEQGLQDGDVVEIIRAVGGG